MHEPGAAGCCVSGYWAWRGCSARDEALRDGVWALGCAAAAGDGGTNVLICPVTALSLLGWGVAGSCAQWGAPWGWGLGLGQGHPCPSPARNGAVPSTVLIPPSSPPAPHLPPALGHPPGVLRLLHALRLQPGRGELAGGGKGRGGLAGSRAQRWDPSPMPKCWLCPQTYPRESSPGAGAVCEGCGTVGWCHPLEGRAGEAPSSCSSSTWVP